MGDAKSDEGEGRGGDRKGRKISPRDRSSQGAATETTAVEDDGGSHPIFFSLDWGKILIFLFYN